MEASLETRAHHSGPVLLGARVEEMPAEILVEAFAQASAQLVAHPVSEDVLAEILAQGMPVRFQMVGSPALLEVVLSLAP